ncbi:hypothetical protein ACFPRL_28405 [Pseudoclavibacter helvolus]
MSSSVYCQVRPECASHRPLSGPGSPSFASSVVWEFALVAHAW